jgi:hypothetical protein
MRARIQVCLFLTGAVVACGRESSPGEESLGGQAGATAGSSAGGSSNSSDGAPTGGVPAAGAKASGGASEALGGAGSGGRTAGTGGGALGGSTGGAIASSGNAGVGGSIRDATRRECAPFCQLLVRACPAEPTENCLSGCLDQADILEQAAHCEMELYQLYFCFNHSLTPADIDCAGPTILGCLNEQQRYSACL